MQLPNRTLAPVLLALAFVCPVAPARSDDEPKAARLAVEGAWTMVSKKNDAGEDEKLPEGFHMVKLVTGGRFAWTIYTDGKLHSAAGGRYTVKDNQYTEKIDYTAGEGNEALLGKEFTFTWEVKGDTWHHVGELKLDGQTIKIDENWERSK
jgi:hypothetical protein